MTAAKTQNAPLVVKMVVLTVAMFGFGFALVPLYDVFCDLTGLNGKVSLTGAEVQSFEVDENREVVLEMITSLNENMPLSFKAEQSRLRVVPGKYYTVNFTATNHTDRPMVGQAIPSVSPGLASSHVIKTECFCFKQQRFEPGESKTMPVRLTINPALNTNTKMVTLSYTFFDITHTVAAH